MNDQQLNRRLQSVGMTCFIKYFREFSNWSLSNQAVAEVLMEHEPYTEKSCKSRVTHARSIIGAGRTEDALLMIANANVPHWVSEQAKEFAKEL